MPLPWFILSRVGILDDKVFFWHQFTKKHCKLKLHTNTYFAYYILQPDITTSKLGYIMRYNRAYSEDIKAKKRAVRIVTLSWYIKLEPLFKYLNLLNMEDLHKLNQYKFIFMLRNNTLPPNLSPYLSPLHISDNHNTRHKHHLIIPKINMNLPKSQFDIIYLSFLIKLLL